MDGLDIRGVFGAALGLVPPWRVATVNFKEDASRLDIELVYARAAKFPCPTAGCAEQTCNIHDTLVKSWRHLDFFQHEAYLSAKVPRVKCPTHGVHLVDVAWARPGSGFTLLFEAALLTLAKHTPVAPLAASARIHDTRLWRVLTHHVEKARAGLDFSEVTRIGVDETSARRGHKYVSVFMDTDEGRVLYATPGKDAATVAAFAKDLDAHGGAAATQIQEVCQDMSPAFMKGVREHLSTPAVNTTDEGTAVDISTDTGQASQAVAESVGHTPQIVFDRYHVVAKMNEAVDLVRRAESKIRPELKGSRYVWLKNETNLTQKQQDQKTWLTRPSLALQTMRAARWRDDFNGFYHQPDTQAAEAYLRAWCYGAKRSRLEPVKAFVRMVEAHWDGIIAWQKTRSSNGLLEGTNSLIQAAKRRARGYRSTERMITVIYLIAAKLPLPQIHTI